MLQTWKRTSQLELAKKIRDTERHIIKTSQSALKVLFKQWGEWSYDEASEQIVFNNENALNQYNLLMEKLLKISDEQHSLQQELFNSKK